MSNRNNMIPIPGRLHSVAVGEPVSGADEVLDDALNMEQSKINQLTVGTKNASTGTTGAYPYNGMGRVVLPKNMVNGVNTLTQDMLYKGDPGSRVPNTNTIFVIQYDYVLGEDITVPANCVLEFDGGSISASGNNDTITGANTGIQAGLVKIFNTNVTLAGSWNVAEAYPEWFGAKGDGVTDDTVIIQKSLDFTALVGCILIFQDKTYLITETLRVDIGKTKISTNKGSINATLSNDSNVALALFSSVHQYNNSRCVIEGLRLYSNVDGQSSNKIGIEFKGNSGNLAIAHITLKNICIHGFTYGLYYKENSYAIKVEGANLFNNDYCVYVSNSVNAGENNVLLDSCIFNSSVCIYQDNPNADIYIIGTSLDYSSTFIENIQGGVFVDCSHIEGLGTIKTNDHVYIDNSTILFTSPDDSNAAFNTMTDGMVDINNCFVHGYKSTVDPGNGIVTFARCSYYKHTNSALMNLNNRSRFRSLRGIDIYSMINMTAELDTITVYGTNTESIKFTKQTGGGGTNASFVILIPIKPNTSIGHVVLKIKASGHSYIVNSNIQAVLTNNKDLWGGGTNYKVLKTYSTTNSNELQPSENWQEYALNYNLSNNEYWYREGYNYIALEFNAFAGGVNATYIIGDINVVFL